MKVVIATPLYPPEVGGPARYAKELFERLSAKGLRTELVTFSDVRTYGKGIAHLMYFLRVYRVARDADAVLLFDTWSTGVPTFLAARLRGKKTVLRIGGDFLWESYLARTGERIPLSEFYDKPRQFSIKETLFYWGTHYLLRHVDALVFNTAWQRELWLKAYGFDPTKTQVIENQYPSDRSTPAAQGKVFVAAGRPHVIKNIAMLEAAFAELQKTHPDIALDTRALSPAEHEERIQSAYAVVIPSVSEVSPNTAIDAIRYGKPVIISSDTGSRARLGEAGIFVDTQHEDQIRMAMEKLLDPAEYLRACERVKRFTFSHSWDEVTNEFLSIINTTCAS